MKPMKWLRQGKWKSVWQLVLMERMDIKLQSSSSKIVLLS